MSTGTHRMTLWAGQCARAYGASQSSAPSFSALVGSPDHIHPCPHANNHPDIGRSPVPAGA
jgi:hypothetical protein